MIQSILGDLQFSTGWKTNGEVVFDGKKYPITIKARAYAESDGVTDAQKTAFSAFKKERQQIIGEAEKLLAAYADRNNSGPFVPRTLLFDRDGEYALLCDDGADPDNGVAVVLSPEQKVVLQDDYL